MLIKRNLLLILVILLFTFNGLISCSDSDNSKMTEDEVVHTVQWRMWGGDLTDWSQERGVLGNWSASYQGNGHWIVSVRLDGEVRKWDYDEERDSTKALFTK